MGKQWKQCQTFLGSKITADGDCSHEIRRCLLLGRKVMTNLDSILKSRDITLSTKVRLVKAMVFPVVMYRCESWTVKKAECQSRPCSDSSATPMNRSMPGLPVHHQLPEFTQTHVHRVSDAIQPSHPRSSCTKPSGVPRAPPKSTVCLTSQRHPEKLPEVTGTSRGNPVFPAAT